MIKPEVCARGSQTGANPNSFENYSQLSGTSLACPLVGGVAALIIQAKPDWTARMLGGYYDDRIYGR